MNILYISVFFNKISDFANSLYRKYQQKCLRNDWIVQYMKLWLERGEYLPVIDEILSHWKGTHCAKFNSRKPRRQI